MSMLEDIMQKDDEIDSLKSALRIERKKRLAWERWARDNSFGNVTAGNIQNTLREINAIGRKKAVKHV
jgi:hypothetical protein